MSTNVFQTGKPSSSRHHRSRWRPRTVQLVALSAACALMGSRDFHGKETAPNEYEVKAAFLYNFGKFVQWPAQAAPALENSFELCVLGDDPFGPSLYRTIAAETIDGRHVVARQIFTAQEAGNCRILFISVSEAAELTDVLTALDGTSVLTVSDMPEFARRGGMIQFVLRDKKVRFAINLPAAEHAGLRLSSQLIKLAVGEPGVPLPQG